MSQRFLDDLLRRIAKGPDLLRSGLGDGPVMTVLTPKVARCRVDTEVSMARDHVIHRFQFDGIDLKAARPPVHQAMKYSRPIFPVTTEAPSSFRYQTAPKAELTLNGIIPGLLVKQGLPIKGGLDSLGLGERGEEMGTHAPKQGTEEPFLQE